MDVGDAMPVGMLVILLLVLPSILYLTGDLTQIYALKQVAGGLCLLAILFIGSSIIAGIRSRNASSRLESRVKRIEESLDLITRDARFELQFLDQENEQCRVIGVGEDLVLVRGPKESSLSRSEMVSEVLRVKAQVSVCSRKSVESRDV